MSATCLYKGDVTSKRLNISYIASDVECLGVEVSLRKVKWLVICS